MTVKLYLESIEAAYAQTFDAQVLAVDGDSIVLDRTLFYPLGGGQHWDTGCLLYTSPSPRDRSISRMPSSA